MGSLVILAVAGCGDGPAEPEPTPLTIETRLIQAGLVDHPFRAALRVAEPAGAVAEWDVSTGRLPGGLAVRDSLIIGVPTEPGRFEIELTARVGERTGSRSFAIVVVEDDQDRFNLTVVTGPLDPRIREQLDSAIARIEEVILGDVPNDGQVPPSFFPSAACLGWGSTFNGSSVDDIMLVFEVGTPVDGYLAATAPCALSDAGFPAYGAIAFLDTFAEELLSSEGGARRMRDVIIHEMLHAVGFGRVWQASSHDLIDGLDTVDPRFKGDAAAAEFQALGGTGLVPVENDGGPGPANTHWEEDGAGPRDGESGVTRPGLDTEVMTPGETTAGVPLPLSRITIASLADFGYDVDLDRADPIALAFRSALWAAGPAFREALGSGPIRVLPGPRD